jgi:hypothetical protein
MTTEEPGCASGASEALSPVSLDASLRLSSSSPPSLAPSRCETSCAGALCASRCALAWFNLQRAAVAPGSSRLAAALQSQRALWRRRTGGTGAAARPAASSSQRRLTMGVVRVLYLLKPEQLRSLLRQCRAALGRRARPAAPRVRPAGGSQCAESSRRAFHRISESEVCLQQQFLL